MSGNRFHSLSYSCFKAVILPISSGTLPSLLPDKFLQRHREPHLMPLGCLVTVTASAK